jgi:two-component system sensor histidine kinase BaeS
MTRRLALAIVGVVVASLVLAGLGTLALARAGAEEAIEDELATQAEALAAVAEVTEPRLPDTTGTLGQRFDAVSSSLAADGVGLVVVLPGGGLRGELPSGLTTDDIEVERLLAGETVVGSKGDVIFAGAAAQRSETVSVLVVLTREERTVLREASRWFLLASTATVLLAALVAVVLGHRLARPVVEAAAATTKVAGGDLTVRLREPPRRKRDELAELTRSVNAMAEALERSRGLEQQFLLSVSHDLRTPLTSIRGYAEAIGDGAIEPHRAAETILNESRRLQRLVQDLLDLANLDARTFSMHPELLDVGIVAGEVVEGMEADARAGGVHLDVAGRPDHELLALADRDRLAQVVANLVENALKFADQRVTVVVRPIAPVGEPEVVELRVADDGPGIEPDDLPHVFERLYVTRRVPVRKEVGSGLGLAIVRDLTTAMGGRVAVRSQPGDGTTFTVTLPAARPGA